MNATRDRLERKLSIIKILCKNPGIGLAELESYTGRSKSELSNDLGELFMVGSYPYTPADYIDIDYDGKSINLNLPASLDKTIGLSIKEWLAIRSMVESILEEKQGMQDESILKKILGKIQKIIPSDRFLDNEKNRSLLQQAINQGLRVKFDYQSRNEKKVENREVDPWVIFEEQKSYLAAYCHTKKGIRSFRLENIQNLSITEIPIQIFPTKEETEQFVQSFREFVEKTTEISAEAEILVSPTAYFNLSRLLELETLDSKLIYKGKEYRKEKTKIVHEGWFLDIIKSFGNSVIILSPKDLRDIMVKDLDQGLFSITTSI